MKQYYKFIAINVGNIESFIEEERNRDTQSEIQELLDKYNNNPNIKCFVLRLNYDNELMLNDYKTEFGEEFHMFDYVRDLMKNKGAEVLRGYEFVNSKLI